VSYCQRQVVDAVLKVCANCRRAVYMSVPSYDICMACRAGRPPLGPVVPFINNEPRRDVNGNSIDGP
jgi:hypothetical protein